MQHPFKAAWPQIRAVLVALHVASMVVLSLPSENAVHNRARWRTANAREDLRQWAERLQGWGIETTTESFERSLWDAGSVYVAVHKPLAAPFRHYATLSGSRQVWQMFASPQRHPAALHVDLKVSGQWQPLYRPHDDDHAWNREQFDHNRFRKFLGRFARGFVRPHYDQTARFIATRAAHEHPDASAVRVQLWRYRTLTPARIQAGEQPEGRYEHPRVFEAEALR